MSADASLTLTAGAAGGPAHVAQVALRGGGTGSSATDSPLEPSLQHTLSLFLFPNGTTYAGVHTAHADHEDEESGLQVSVSPRELVSHKLAVACGVLEAATRQGGDGIVTYSVAGARVLLAGQDATTMGDHAPQATAGGDVFAVSELHATNVNLLEHHHRVIASERQEAELLGAGRARRRLLATPFLARRSRTQRVLEKTG